MTGCALLRVTESGVVVVLPATSVAVTFTVLSPAAKPVEHVNEPLCTRAAIELHEIAATPERASATLPVIWSVGVLTVELFAGEVTVIVGGVLSMLIVALVLALLPALSTAVPVAI